VTHPYDAGGSLPAGQTMAVNATGEAEPVGPVPPWPVVPECYKHTNPDETCPQCDGSHEHVWKAWLDAPKTGSGSAVVGGTSGPGVPVRCTVCGGRKCDLSNCSGRRHHAPPHTPF
jgi:hypothetical protein